MAISARRPSRKAYSTFGCFCTVARSSSNSLARASADACRGARKSCLKSSADRTENRVQVAECRQRENLSHDVGCCIREFPLVHAALIFCRVSLGVLHRRWSLGTEREARSKSCRDGNATATTNQCSLNLTNVTPFDCHRHREKSIFWKQMLDPHVNVATELDLQELGLTPSSMLSACFIEYSSLRRSTVPPRSNIKFLTVIHTWKILCCMERSMPNNIHANVRNFPAASAEHDCPRASTSLPISTDSSVKGEKKLTIFDTPLGFIGIWKRNFQFGIPVDTKHKSLHETTHFFSCRSSARSFHSNQEVKKGPIPFSKSVRNNATEPHNGTAPGPLAIHCVQHIRAACIFIPLSFFLSDIWSLIQAVPPDRSRSVLCNLVSVLTLDLFFDFMYTFWHHIHGVYVVQIAMPSPHRQNTVAQFSDVTPCILPLPFWELLTSSIFSMFAEIIESTLLRTRLTTQRWVLWGFYLTPRCSRQVVRVRDTIDFAKRSSNLTTSCSSKKHRLVLKQCKISELYISDFLQGSCQLIRARWDVQLVHQMFGCTCYWKRTSHFVSRGDKVHVCFWFVSTLSINLSTCEKMSWTNMTLCHVLWIVFLTHSCGACVSVWW